MAIDREAKVIISAVDKYSSVFNSANVSFASLGKAALGASTAIATMSVALAALTVKMGTSAVQAAADFRDAIIDVEAVVGTTGANSKEIEGILDSLVTKFPVTGKQAGQALESIAQFGFSAKEELSGITEAALELQIATGTELDTSVAALTATMKQFGIEADNVTRISNVFAAAQFSSAATTSDLREAMKFAGPAAGAFGRDLEETVAFVSLLKDEGLEASQSGTVLRQSLAQLANETKKGSDALERLGLTYADVNPETNSFVQILEKFEGKTVTAKDAIDIFGVRQLAFNNILKKGSGVLQERIDQISNTSASEDAARKKSEQWAVVLNNLDGVLDAFKKTIGQDLLPVIIEFIGKDEKSGIRGAIAQLIEFEKSAGGIGGPLISAFEALKDAVENIFAEQFQGDIENVYGWLVKISTALGENLKIILDLGQKFASAFIEVTSSTENLNTALTIVKNSFVAIGALIAGGILLKGISTISSIATGLKGLAVNRTSVFKVLFRGKGSAERDLSEKIKEMDILYRNFRTNIEKPVTTRSDFGPLRKSITESGRKMTSFRGLVNEAGGAINLLSQAVAAAGIGYAIGTWVDGIKLFGDGTVTVGEKVESIFSRILGATDGQKEALDRLLKSLDDFKNVEIRTSVPLDEIDDYVASLKFARDFQQAFIKQQEVGLDEAALKWGKNSDVVQDYTKRIEKAREKIDEINKSLSDVQNIDIGLGDISDGLKEIEEKRKQAAEAAKSIIKEIVEANKEGNKTIVVEQKKSIDERIANEEQLLQFGAITLEEFEARKIKIIENGNKEQIKLAEDVKNAQKDTNSEIEKATLESGEKIFSAKKRTAEETIEFEKQRIEEEKKLYEQGFIDVEEFEKRKAAIIESSNKDQIKLAEENVEKTRKLYEDELSFFELRGNKITELEKATRDGLLKLIQDEEDKVTALRQQAEKDREKIAEKRIEIIEESLEKEEALFKEAIDNINLLEAEGTISAKEAFDDRLKAEEDYLENKVKKTQEAYELTQRFYPEDVEKQKEALRASQDAQSEFTNFRISKMQAERDALEAILENEIAIRRTNADIAINEIQKSENAGVISAQQASAQKKQIEEEFLQFKIQKLQEAVELAAQEFGKESQQYAEAVLEKSNAETELSNSRAELTSKTDEAAEATKNLGSAAEVAAGLNAAFNDRLATSKENLNDVLVELQNTRKFFETFGQGAFELVEIDAGTQSLRDLSNVAANARQALSSLAATNLEGIARFEVSEDLNKIRELGGEFQNIAQSAADVGLRVDVMDQTLTEAADDVANRIEGWTNFRETLDDITTSFQIATDDLKIFMDLSSAGIERNFTGDINSISSAIGTLGEQINKVNKEFGTGNIESAQEMAEGVIDEYERIYDFAVDILDDLKSEWETLADEIVKTNEKITDIQQTTEEKIREARRATLDELGQFQDIRLEYDEVYASAQEALSQKQFEKAAELFEKAADIAEELQQEVKDGSGEVVSSLEENTTLSIGLMQKASDAAVKALNNQNESLLSQQGAIQSQINQTTSSMQSLGGEINEAFRGIDEASRDILNLGNRLDNIADTSMNFDFTGTGSSKKPLSEKIKEMEGKIEGFGKNAEEVAPKINSDFTGISRNVKDLSSELNKISVDSNEFSRIGRGLGGISTLVEPQGRIGRGLGGGGSPIDFSSIVESNKTLVDAIKKFSFPEKFVFNVDLQSNGADWLRGLTKSLIDEIFIQAEAEQLVVFGQEG